MTSPTQTVFITLIIPAHNEEARLGTTLQRYSDALLERCGPAFEIIVVANGCEDATADVAHRMAATYPQIRVIEIEARIGKGGAILAGFEAAEALDIAFVDADGATEPESLLDLLDQLKLFDVVIGSRRLPNSVITRKQPLKRQLFGSMFALTARWMFGLPYRDTQCGAKAFRAESAQLLARRVRERSWMFDLDLLLCASAAGCSILEYPVTWADQPGSQLRLLPTARNVVGALWRLKRRSLATTDFEDEVAPSYIPQVSGVEPDSAVVATVR